MRKKRIKIKTLYFIIFLIILTICFYILNTLYLFEKGKFFKADYTRYDHIYHFFLLDKNPKFDVVHIHQTTQGIYLTYKNLDTNAVKQTEFPGYSINPVLGADFNNFYYDEDENFYMIMITYNDSDYKLLEIDALDGDITYRQYPIFRYELYDELQEESLEINDVRFYPAVFDKDDEIMRINSFKDGYKISFENDTFRKLRKVNWNDIENNDFYLFICNEIKKNVNKEILPIELFEIIYFRARNKFFQSTFFENICSGYNGFLGARVVGKVDANNDNIKDYLIHIKGKRFVNELLICYDKTKAEIIWKREFIFGLRENIKIHDIDKDGFDEIIFSTTSYCNEPSPDWFRKKEIGESCFSYFYILDNHGKDKMINNRPAVLQSEYGQMNFIYYPFFKQNKILLAYSRHGEHLTGNFKVYDLIKNELSEINVPFISIIQFIEEDGNIVAFNVNN